MSQVIEASVLRYHEKIAGNFLGDWIKKHFPIPSKEKAIKILKKHIKSEKDVDDLYKAMPNMINFLKSKKADDRIPINQLFPPGFVKNLVMFIALISLVGHIYPRGTVVEKLKDQKVIVMDRGYEMPEKDKFLGEVSLSKNIIKKLNPSGSIEDMNKSLLKLIKDKKLKEMSNTTDLPNIAKIKYPLQVKITTDKAGNRSLYPSQIKKLKDGDSIYLHQHYTVERYEEIEKNLEKMKNEKI